MLRNVEQPFQAAEVNRQAKSLPHDESDVELALLPAAMLLHSPTILSTDEHGVVESISFTDEGTAPDGVETVLGRPWRSLFAGMKQVELPDAPEPEQGVFVGAGEKGDMAYWVQVRRGRGKDGECGFVLVEPVAGNALLERLSKCENIFAMGNMAPHVVHEINNALTIASTQMEILMQDVPSGDPLSESLAVVKDEVARIAGIARNILTQARVTEPGKRLMDVNDVLTRVLLLQSYPMKMENIEVEIDLPPKPPLLMADEGRLQRVFVNLVLNARQAMPDGGRLMVRSRHTDEWYEVTLADTGCGIAPADIERIFEPYFTTKAESGGTGLGLAVSRQYIEAVGGTLNVHSTPGQGARFIVRLPVQE